MWRVVVGTAGLLVALVVAALLNLGLISIPGNGQAMARYQSADITAAPGAQQWTFDDMAVGGLPSGAEVLSQPRFGQWAVRAEADAPSQPNALCQTGIAEFPSLALTQAVYGDLAMSARFKPISGQEDQAAGLLFRIQDRNNYYILRANVLENNVNFYKYQNGRRSLLAQSRVAVPSGQWQELRLEATGTSFRGFLNLDGQPVVEASDGSYAEGRVGLWTKADSVTCFDNVQVQAP